MAEQPGTDRPGTDDVGELVRRWAAGSGPAPDPSSAGATAPVLEHALLARDADLALLAALDATSADVLADDGRLPDAAARAVASGLDLGPLDERVLRSEPGVGTLSHERRAVVRREVELASRVLVPPQETPAAPDAELSVVVTAHDVGPWIGQTLQTLGEQDARLDVVVVADHCTDETLEVVRAATAGLGPDVALRVVLPRLRGGAHARNVGAALATAPRLAFCDGDDLVGPGAYRRLLDAADRSGAPLTLGPFLKFRPDHTWSPVLRWDAYATPATHAGIEAAPQLMFHRACWNKVLDTAWWREQDIVFPEVPRSNDVVPVTRAYLAARPVTVVEDLVYLYRDRPGQSSMSSKVGTEVSLRSYLEQEGECADLVLRHRDPHVHDEYARLVTHEDAWIQVGRYLRACAADDLAPDPQVLALCRSLVARFGTEQFADLPLSSRITFAASATDRDDLVLAAALTDGRESALVRADGWARVLGLGALPRDPRFPPREDVGRHGIVPTLDDLLDDDALAVDDTAAALDGLLGAVRAHGPAAGVPDLVDPAVRQAAERAGTGGLLPHVALLRRAAPTARRTWREGDHAVGLEGSSGGGTSVVALHALDEANVLRDLPHSVVPGSVGPGWQVLVRDDALTLGRSRLLATVRDDATGEEVLAHVRTALEPPYPTPRRRETLHVRPDMGPANVVATRRRSAPSRAVRRAARPLLRRR